MNGGTNGGTRGGGEGEGGLRTSVVNSEPIPKRSRPREQERRRDRRRTTFATSRTPATRRPRDAMFYDAAQLYTPPYRPLLSYHSALASARRRLPGAVLCASPSDPTLEVRAGEADVTYLHCPTPPDASPRGSGPGMARRERSALATWDTCTVADEGLEFFLRLEPRQQLLARPRRRQTR